MKILKTVPFAALAVLFVVTTGCATKISLEAERTPTMDTSAIKRVAVLPFENRSNVSAGSNVASFLTGEISSKMQATNAFTLVNADTVRNAERNGESMESFVDATFSGRITSITSEDTYRDRQVKNATTGVVSTVRDYIREVNVSFEYFFTLARDGTMLGPVTKTGRTTVTAAKTSDIDSVESMAKTIVSRQLGNFNQDVVPYMVTISRKLEKETSKDKALKELMKNAEAQAKAGSYVAAQEAYLAIWQEHGSVAAAINVSILQEALGGLQDASAFIQGVYAATGSPKVAARFSAINAELGEVAELAEFNANAATPAMAKVTGYAIGEISKVASSGAKIWIYSNDASNQALANDVIDNMTASFISSGYTVVERGMIDMVLSEQNRQLDGSISDSDFISIGNLAGANTIVVVGITGAGSARRLQCKVLDIATGTVVMQSNTDDAWSL